MDMVLDRKALTRRSLLKKSVTLGAAFVVGTHWVASYNAAWALKLAHVSPESMATLIQLARDIYPHDHIGDEFYAAAVKGYDSGESAKMIEDGIAGLNAAARGKGFANYLDAGWERDRIDILRGMENSEFFQTIRGGLVTGLYNQKAVWPLFGYEGESYSKGGYIDRGFDDINWL
tara:strand:- start:4024 stop:4548 length:525 start_codon:yes stop_codon:yes gene_type:complete